MWLTVEPIPANAGETCLPSMPNILSRAYPRERGGNGELGTGASTGLGLSPRARGKLLDMLGHPISSGPIPASAGETGARGGGSTQALGLSPRARGKPPSAQHLPGDDGAYPRERGGNSIDIHLAIAARWAYPRERGGNILMAWL